MGRDMAAIGDISWVVHNSGYVKDSGLSLPLQSAKRRKASEARRLTSKTRSFQRISLARPLKIPPDVCHTTLGTNPRAALLLGRERRTINQATMSTCFDRSSNQNLKFVACDATGSLKSCCAPGDSCASNGLCVTSSTDTLTPYFINGCTEQNWDSDTCLKQCDSCTS